MTVTLSKDEGTVPGTSAENAVGPSAVFKERLTSRKAKVHHGRQMASQLSDGASGYG